MLGMIDARSTHLREGVTDRRTDTPLYEDATAHLKSGKKEKEERWKGGKRKEGCKDAEERWKGGSRNNGGKKAEKERWNGDRRKRVGSRGQGKGEECVLAICTRICL